jgi:hypothetical protein
MPVQIKFDPHITMPQVALIQDATPNNDGVMTALQAAELAALVAGGGGGGASKAPRMTIVQTIGPVVAVAYGDAVAADPSGANITANLPAASAVTPTGSNTVTLSNNSDSANVVNVTPAGGDTVNGGGVFVLAARESVTLVSDGVSNWMPF